MMSNEFIGKSMMEPIEGETVVQQIIKRLIAAIQDERFVVGERLPSEFELMKELHVSRNSLREAIKILVAMGVLEIKRGEGTYLCSQAKPTMFDSIIYSMILESSSDEDIAELRQLLDEVVLKMAVKKSSEEDIEALENNLHDMRAQFGNGDYTAAGTLDFEFHMLLIDSSKNPFLSRIVKGVYKLFEHSIGENIRREGEFARADEYHQEIINCLKSRDVKDVERVIANSLTSWEKNVKL